PRYLRSALSLLYALPTFIAIELEHLFLGHDVRLGRPGHRRVVAVGSEQLHVVDRHRAAQSAKAKEVEIEPGERTRRHALQVAGRSGGHTSELHAPEHILW